MCTHCKQVFVSGPEQRRGTRVNGGWLELPYLENAVGDVGSARLEGALLCCVVLIRFWQ